MSISTIRMIFYIIRILDQALELHCAETHQSVSVRWSSKAPLYRGSIFIDPLSSICQMFLIVKIDVHRMISGFWTRYEYLGFVLVWVMFSQIQISARIWVRIWWKWSLPWSVDWYRLVCLAPKIQNDEILQEGIEKKMTKGKIQLCFDYTRL